VERWGLNSGEFSYGGVRRSGSVCWKEDEEEEEDEEDEEDEEEDELWSCAGW
jgi:hypothetical protein